MQCFGIDHWRRSAQEVICWRSERASWPLHGIRVRHTKGINVGPCMVEFQRRQTPIQRVGATFGYDNVPPTAREVVTNIAEAYPRVAAATVGVAALGVGAGVGVGLASGCGGGEAVEARPSSPISEPGNNGPASTTAARGGVSGRPPENSVNV